MFVLYADKTQLTVCEKEPVTSGSVNAFQVRFDFSADWDGLEKTAIFQAGCVEVAIPLTSGACIIPAKVLATAGHFLSVGVFGKFGETTMLPTVWATLGLIQEGAIPGDTPGPTPPPEDWEAALEGKGDNLSLSGQTLDLRSGETVLSSVELPGGGEGTPGTPGPEGPPGPGVPPGGTKDQILTKASAADYDTQWADLPEGGGGSIPGDVPLLVKTSAEYAAMSEEEKQADVMFAITDDHPSGDGNTGVASFAGRTGAVLPQQGDYTADMVGAATMEQVNAAINEAITGAIEESY